MLFSKACKTPLETLIAEAQADPDAELLLGSKKSRDAYQPQVGDVVEILSCYGEDLGSIGPKGVTGRVTVVDCDDDSLCVECEKTGGWHLYLSDVRPVAEPTFTGTYTERQAQWVEHHGLKVGDKVKVVREYTKDEDGFGRVCAKGKDDAVGKTLSVIGIDNVNGAAIKLSTRIFGSEWFPYFVLEPVKE